jgi:membrane fusion protein, heavy metal efflux system
MENFKNRNAIIAAASVVVVALLMFAILRPRTGGSAGEAVAEAGPLDYPRGPHGARLLSEGDLQLEVTIYEEGVPPHFRVYPYDAGLEPVAPADVQLQIQLHRLGGRVDTIPFRPEADYLVGGAVVEEPHSFDVKVFAQRAGKTYEWEYSQIEGKVQLGADQIASAGIEIGIVGPRMMMTTLDLPGEVRTDETRLAHVVPRLQGVATSVLKKEGDFVREGELIAVLRSRELADAKSDYLEAEHHVEFTRVALTREESLFQKKISAERDYLGAKRDFDEAQLRLQLASQQLIVLGVPAADLPRLAAAPAETMATFEIRAPLTGTVIERNLTVGEAVTADEHIFTVADMSTVWVDVTVPARDLALVKVGQEASVVSTDLGTTVTGRVSYIGPVLGQETRAATARIVLPNPGGQWRPGLFVTTRLVRDQVMVPLVIAAEAIQTFRDWQVVFVKYGDWFEARPLVLGRSDGQWVEVLSGLSPGVEYATVNSFAIKAEIGKLGATHDH